MPNYLKKLMTIALSSSLLVACANAPTSVVVSPEVMISQSSLNANKSATLTVQDMRTAQHIIEIKKKDQAAQLLSLGNSLTSAIQTPMQKSFEKTGLLISGSSGNQVTLFINSALISVEQELTKYSSASQIRLTAKVENNNETLTKTFNSKTTSEGVLKADIAVLERDFSQQLANLLGQIAQDPEISQYLQ